MTNDPFKALAHPLRRGIVERLSGGTVTVREATRDFGVSKPTISRHLKMLEEAGVVTRVIDGRTRRLALQPQTSPTLRDGSSVSALAGRGSSMRLASTSRRSDD
jgi:DNA-binding transcriptional ArsR family regulator